MLALPDICPWRTPWIYIFYKTMMGDSDPSHAIWDWKTCGQGSDVNRLKNLNRLKTSFNRLIIAINRLIAIKNFNRLID